MSTAIWAIRHTIATHHRDRYLTWFHGTHIPEKLARPGYTWAAHYRAASGGAEGADAYLALFGGVNTRVFYDPSPAQLKLKQDDLTREMMAMRVGSSAVIFGEEWRHGDCGIDAVEAPVIRLTVADVTPGDEKFAAWCAQQYFPRIAGLQGFRAVRKLFGSSGSPRHAILEEYESTWTSDEDARAAHDAADAEVAGEIATVLYGERLWPES